MINSPKMRRILGRIPATEALGSLAAISICINETAKSIPLAVPIEQINATLKALTEYYNERSMEEVLERVRKKVLERALKN